MEYISLGRSNLLVSRTAFSASGLARAERDEDASSLVRAAYEGGINFFDASRLFPQTERRMGIALRDVREDVILASKTASRTAGEVLRDFEQSLEALESPRLELYQLIVEADDPLPAPKDADGGYDALLKLKKEGRIRGLGVVCTNPDTARSAVESGFYDVLQFPFNMLLPEETEEIVSLCAGHDVGFIAMKPLCGGLVMNIPLAFGFIRQYENAVPVWGVANLDELRQILFFEQHPPSVDGSFMEDVAQLRDFFS